MKVYQLAAHGTLTTFNNHHTMYSKKVYRTEEQAREAMLEFSKLVTIPKDEHDMMVMEKENLRISINTLELVNNKKEKKDG